MESPEEFEITTEEVLLLATTAHQQGVTDKAQEFYQVLLQAQPDNIDALHYYGILLHQTGRSDDGLASIERALSLGATGAEIHNNKGNILKELKRYPQAQAQYQKALEIDPDNVDALCNLAVALRVDDQDEAAIDCLRRATQLDPEHGETWHNLGNALREQGETMEAIRCYEKAVAFGAYRHSSGKSARNLAIVLAATGRIDEAKQVLRNWMAQDPNSPIAKHLLAALTKEDVPERAANDFVVQSFRDYAATFDESLAHLKYQAPQLVGARVEALLPPPERTLAVCDLGCGTGLAAEFVAPYAQRLTGVDLSVQMLSKAAERNLYQELIEEEITLYMSTQHAAFDLVTCVDTLCYLGKLDDLFQHTCTALRPAGYFVFTVEAMPEDSGHTSYEIGPSGRYRQSAAYLENALKRAGFDTPEIERQVLRNEGGKPVDGYVCSVRVPATPARGEASLQ